MNSKLINTIASLVFAALVAGGFFTLWIMSKNVSQSQPVADDLKAVEIDSVKKDAETVLDGLQKTGDIPIPTPTAKMGNSNPF